MDHRGAGVDRGRVYARAGGVSVAVIVMVALLSACAPTPSPSPVSTISMSPSASPIATPTSGTPSPIPTSDPSLSPTPVAPVAPAVTVITLEVVDGSVEASGIVPQLQEEGGDCVLTVSRSGARVEESLPASQGRDGVFCGLVSISTSRLASGTWDAVLSYRSAKTNVESAVAQVEIP